ncbi:MAG: hypothetical protein ACOYZ7_13620 [Chloroflexota bacterium]
MNDQDGLDKQAFVRHLVSRVRCPVCQRSYTPADILALEHSPQGEMWLAVLSCAMCQTQGLVVAIEQRTSDAEQPFTELTARERASLAHRKPITSDDVLDWHEFLRDYQGDIAELAGW